MISFEDFLTRSQKLKRQPFSRLRQGAKFFVDASELRLIRAVELSPVLCLKILVDCDVLYVHNIPGFSRLNFSVKRNRIAVCGD